jgi:hypothetical protein
MFRVLIFAALLLVSSSPSYSVEVNRGGTGYNINVKLPPGHSFYSDGLDRKFIIGDLGGIFRLIQDSYSGCGQLVDERIKNRKKDGFTQITRTAITEGDCAVSIINQERKLTAASFYIWIDKCSCFSAIHFYYSTSDRDQYLKVVQPILDSIRANNF